MSQIKLELENYHAQICTLGAVAIEIKKKQRLLLEKIGGKTYEQESKEIEQDDQNKFLSYSLSKKELIYRFRIDAETNTKAVTNLLEFKMNLTCSFLVACFP